MLEIEESERLRRSLKRRRDNARLGTFKPMADFDYQRGQLSPQGSQRARRKTRRRPLHRQEIPHREPIAMEPNDLPIVCLPLELSDGAAVALLDFLYAITSALERHYTAQIMRYEHERRSRPAPSDPADSPTDDPPF